MGKFLEGVFDDLSLYARQCAWYAAVPERAQNDRSKTPALSRLAQLRKNLANPQFEPDMPPVDAGLQLLAYFFEIGPTVASGMGAGPINHAEILAWQQNVGIELSSWEARSLRRLSRVYLQELNEATDRRRPEPWKQARATQNAAAVAATREAMRALANK